MYFSEALQQLKARLPMYRTCWKSEDGYLVLMPTMTHVWKIVLHPAPNAGNYIFAVADLEADDWAVYSEPKEPIAAVETKAA